MKTGANEKCPCGSNSKYKKCCMQKETEEKKELMKEYINYA